MLERIVVPQIQEQVVEVFKVIRQERVSERVGGLVVAGPQIQELPVAVFKVTPPTRSQSEETNHRDLEVLVAFVKPQENGGSVSFD